VNAILEPEALVAPNGPTRLVLTARLEPVGDLDRFQPAGFPEIGHVIYDAPRGDDGVEKVCIVDSPASMANHLESVCLRTTFDPTPVTELASLPYVRCVTDAGWPDKEKMKSGSREVVRTSLTEGHRIASTYFLDGQRLSDGDAGKVRFEDELRAECNILPLDKKAHPLPDAWWATFRTLFRYDPNSLVHGVLFPQWQVKVSRVLTAHHEARGAGRVDYSGVKFDRLGVTTSGQPIFAVDDETASEIRATFIVDLALLRSFGRDEMGLGRPEKEALAALALWKVGRLLASPFRYRSRCDLACRSLAYRTDNGTPVDVDPADLASVPVAQHLDNGIAHFNERERAQPNGGRPVAGVTDVYWPPGDLYKKGTGDGSDVGAEEPAE
jgi:CRISPR-associated protein Csb1